MFRPIYEPRTKAREYCDLAVNIYTGCNHGCTYCYAPRILHKKREDFDDLAPRKDLLESVVNQLKREKFIDKKIMLCFTCDPYPAILETGITRGVIRIIKNTGNHVQILTKGGARAVRDFDLLDENDSFGVTISCNNSEEVEPGAAPVAERIRTLQIAHSLGIKTWVSCEPVFEPKAVYRLITNCNYIDLYRIGKLNYMKSEIDWALFGKTAERLCIQHGRNYYIKDDLRKIMDAAEKEGGA